MRIAVIAVVCSLASAGVAGPGFAAGRDVETVGAAACRHYDNRARFLPRSGPHIAPIAAIADACAGAQAAVASPEADAATRAAAAAYLETLAAVHGEIRRINAERAAPMFSERGRLASAEGQSPVRSLSRSMGLVTTSGEHLILRAGGVFAALQGWLAASAAFAMADDPAR
ncbi:hypothetical protein SAMN05444370_102319 [Rubrimonas cliftonensis]|uniref:Uncharacterized protein n=2 Tax=Rubrimonas cliftonensis TaxID=89524 RepID=A0A1H3X9L2_9RHOB|nr:hypothetical protein SAMN05444370_102319 [Rubrimonas cliftonensis]